jgi:hypothetical protein
VYGVKFALISGVGLLVCITPAKAERWSVVIQKDADGTSYLADSDFQIDEASPTITFWTHAFYETPRYGMKSLKVEYTVHCTNRTIVKQSYYELDAEDNVVFSGKNNNDTSAKTVVSGSIEDRLLTFACSSSTFREENYVVLSEKSDYQNLRILSPEPRKTVSTTVPTTATKIKADTRDSLYMVASVRRYQDCVMKSAVRLAKSYEKSSVVTQAAVSNCAISRLQVVATYKTAFGSTLDETRKFILSIDNQMLLLAEREVTKLR